MTVLDCSVWASTFRQEKSGKLPVFSLLNRARRWGSKRLSIWSTYVKRKALKCFQGKYLFRRILNTEQLSISAVGGLPVIRIATLLRSWCSMACRRLGEKLAGGM